MSADTPAAGAHRGSGTVAPGTAEELNPLAIARRQLDIVARRIDLDPDSHEILRSPNRVIQVSIPTEMDDGRVRVFTGYRVHRKETKSRTRSCSSSTAMC